MGRGGLQDQRPSPAPSRRERAISEYIAWLSHRDPQYPSLERAGSSPLEEYGEPPADFEPSICSVEEVGRLAPPRQLEALTVAYGAALTLGQGLTYLSTGTAQSYAEHMVALRAQLFVQKLADEMELDEEEVFERLLLVLRDVEAEFHWTCRRLGWPSGWVLEAVRLTSLALARRSGLLGEDGATLPNPDLEYEATLQEIHGPPPEEVDPLLDLPEGTSRAERGKQLEALERAYGDLIRDMLAEEEMASGRTDGKEARRVQEQLAREAERAGEDDDTAALHRWLKLRRADEARLHWASQALGMPTSSVIAYLKERLRSRS